VSTESARWPGVDINGFPKFIADIDFAMDEGRIICRLATDGESILEFRMDNKVGTRKQEKWEFYGNRKQKIVRTAFDLEGLFSEGESKQNVNLVLGKHVIADTLREW